MYVYLSLSLYIYIYIYHALEAHVAWMKQCPEQLLGLRTNGVNTNGAAAQVIGFDRLGKQARKMDRT